MAGSCGSGKTLLSHSTFYLETRLGWAHRSLGCQLSILGGSFWLSLLDQHQHYMTLQSYSIILPLTLFETSHKLLLTMCWLTNITYRRRRCHMSTCVDLEIRRCEKARKDEKERCDLSNCSEVDQDSSSTFDHCITFVAQYNAWLASGKSYTPDAPFF